MRSETPAIDQEERSLTGGLRVGMSPEVAAHAELHRTLVDAADHLGKLRDGPCDVAVLAAGWELEKLGGVAPAVVAVGDMLTLDEYRQALGWGATALVTWEVGADVLRATLVSATCGRGTLPLWVLEGLAVRLEEPPDAFTLTPWQLDLLRDMAAGHTEGQLAQDRGCSGRKIRRKVAEIWAQMEVTGRTQGLVRAARWGLVGDARAP